MPVSVDGTRGTVYILCSLGIWNISTFLSSVAGTATRIELVAPWCAVACSFIVPCFCSRLHAGLSRHMEKAQKFRVFTARECSSHGWGRCVDTPSAGSMIEKCFSSEARSCQTLRELSRPCVIILSGSHSANPRIAASCACQTATGRFEARFHKMMQPSASPVSNLVFWRTNWTLCTWAA